MTPLVASGIDWGDVPAWIGGVLAGGALLIAALAYLLDSTRRKEDLQERREARLEREARHTRDREANARRLTFAIDRTVVTVENQSDEPFYKVTGWVDGHTDLARIGTLNPGEKDEIRDVIPGVTKWYVVYQDIEDVYWAASRGVKPVKTDETSWEGLRANGHDAPSTSTT